MPTPFRLRFASLTVLAALLLPGALLPRPVQAHPGFNVEVDINYFFDALAPYGHWVDHNRYGRVWYPRDVPRDWRPYTDGHWAHTREYGWLWVSDWEWGWAPFHYGRWAFDDWYGWIWIPGRVWAPAWVMWRHGGGYAAWAPMPPTVIWQPHIGVSLNFFNYDRDLRPDCWVAVRERELGERRFRRRIVEPRDNPQILRITQNVTHVTVINNTIVNPGVPARRIEQLTGKPLAPVRLREVDDPHEFRSRRADHDELAIVRPRLRPPTTEEIHKDEERALRLSREPEEPGRIRRQTRENMESVRFEPRVPGRLTGRPAPETANPPSAAPIVPAEPESTQPEPRASDHPALQRDAMPLGQESDAARRERGRREGRFRERPPAQDGRPAMRRQPPEDALPQSVPSPAPTLREAPSDQVQETATEPVPPEPALREPRRPSGSEEDARQREGWRPRERATPPQTMPQTETPAPVEPYNEAAPLPVQPPDAGSQAPRESQSGAADRSEQVIQTPDRGAQEAPPLQPPMQAQEEHPPGQHHQRQIQMERQQAEQAERVHEEALRQQQRQQQEAAQQEELQRQRQIQLERQQAEQAERVHEEALRQQQRQQQEAAQQEELQRQRQMQLEQQEAEQAERMHEEALHSQQRQQQEAAQQEELQRQRQMQLERQQTEQAERVREEASDSQQRQQEAARRLEVPVQGQRQMELQRQQAEQVEPTPSEVSRRQEEAARREPHGEMREPTGAQSIRDRMRRDRRSLRDERSP